MAKIDIRDLVHNSPSPSVNALTSENQALKSKSRILLNLAVGGFALGLIYYFAYHKKKAEIEKLKIISKDDTE
jgi:hypothetical protein